VNFLRSEKTAVSLVFAGVGLILLALFFLLYKTELSYDVPFDNERLGQFGDFIGGIVGSLWALAGVVLFYSALVYQRRTFELSAEDIEIKKQGLLNRYRVGAPARRARPDPAPMPAE
jgi:hypothetical protein